MSERIANERESNLAEYVDNVVLINSADVHTVSVPSGYTHVRISGSRRVLMRMNSAAPSPDADISDGTGAEIIQGPTLFRIPNSVSTISLRSGGGELHPFFDKGIDPLFRKLDTNGNGTGTTNANGDYSSALEEFYISAPSASERDLILQRIIITIEDTTGFSANEYGNLAAALTNGVVIQHRQSDETIVTDLTDGEPVKTNAGWGSKCYDVDLKTWGVGNEFLLVRWTFERSGSSIHLNGGSGDRLAVRLNDDFTGLVSQSFEVQGAYSSPVLVSLSWIKGRNSY